MSILNLTQRDATPEQVEAGVVEPSDKILVRELLTFEDLPTLDEIRLWTYDLAECARRDRARRAMIGGAPYLMSFLEANLIVHNIQPVYSFSRREIIDEVQPDGSVVKKVVFKHLGFIEVDML